MTQEEKDLLLKDLASRLFCNVRVNYNDLEGADYTLSIKLLSQFPEEKLKPYLRPMSSMTEEEKVEFESLGWRVDELDDNSPWNHNSYKVWNGIDWLNAHHFDYRGLIEKGLALEAPEGMYKNKTDRKSRL